MDVIELVRELGVTTIRYPGGNFVSGYRWEDGVGPRERAAAPPGPGLALTETNEVGIDEFAGWAQGRQRDHVRGQPRHPRRAGGARPAGIRQPRSGTSLSDLRIANGTPRAVRDPDVVPGQRDGRALADRSPDRPELRQARRHDRPRDAPVDPDLELVVCGSSCRDADLRRVGASRPRARLRRRRLHLLPRLLRAVDGDLASFLASAVDMDHFIDRVVATADHVKAVRAGQDDQDLLRRVERLVLSRFARPTGPAVDDWPVAPRLLEDQYSVADAVVVGSLLITLLRNCDRVSARAWRNWST